MCIATDTTQIYKTVTRTQLDEWGLVRQSGFMFCFTCFLAEWPWASYKSLSSLVLPCINVGGIHTYPEGALILLDVKKLSAKIWISSLLFFPVFPLFSFPFYHFVCPCCSKSALIFPFPGDQKFIWLEVG